VSATAVEERRPCTSSEAEVTRVAPDDDAAPLVVADGLAGALDGVPLGAAVVRRAAWSAPGLEQPAAARPSAAICNSSRRLIVMRSP
ncbi:MAG: hypothetical protein ACXV2J_04850, partial [Actinomycetes bacterium]